MISLLRKKRTLVLVLIIISAIFIFAGFFGLKKDGELVGKVEFSSEKSGWNTYTNKDYSFQFDFPSDWRVYEDLNKTFPVISVYKNDLRTDPPPYDPFSNQSHISIFPKGSSAEEIIGKKQSANLDLGLTTKSIDEYLLIDDTLWAIKIVPENLPKDWNDLGFIWFGSRISNLEYTCRSGEEFKDLAECNPFGGDVFERSGKVEDKIQNTQIEILKTFKITE